MRTYTIEEFGSVAGLRMRERPTPSPGPQEILLRVRASALNFRDLRILAGLPSAFAPKLGLVPLGDGAGEVAAVGSEVRRVKAGDRVAAAFFPDWIGGRPTPQQLRTQLGGGSDGMLTEYAIAREESVVPLPAHLSFEEGATLPCAGLTAWVSLAGAGLIPGETVLTQGSGGVSVFAIQFAKLFGARIVATTSSRDKAERLRALGADEIIDYIQEPNWDRRAIELTGGEGVDVVVEVGGPNTMAKSIGATRLGGRIATVGNLAGSAKEGEQSPLRGTGITVRTITVGSRQDFEAMNRAVAHHRLRPVIDRIFPFAEAPAAYSYLESRRHFGKVVIAHPD